MDNHSAAQIAKMLNAFPQSTANVKALLLTYGEVLADIPERAIQETANRYIAGTVPGQNKTFCPSIAEFRDAAEAQAKIIAIRSKPRLPAPEYRRHGPMPYEVTQENARARYAGRPVLFKDISLDTFKKLCADGQVPLGSNWVACLATVYGPAPKAQGEEQAA